MSTSANNRDPNEPGPPQRRLRPIIVATTTLVIAIAIRTLDLGGINPTSVLVVVAISAIICVAIAAELRRR